MSLANIIALRQLLRDKFPGLRTRADELASRSRACCPSGLSGLDEPLGGGFAKSALSEIIAPHRTSGSALLIGHLLEHAAANRQFIALVDGQDSFDPAPFDPAVIAQLLWVRCRNADDALKAADLILRDGNLPLVIIDLALNTDQQLRKIPAPTWYRFQRIVEERGVTCLIVTPHPMVSPAQTRITLQSQFGFDALNRNRIELVHEVEFEVSEMRRGVLDESLQQTA